MTRLFIAVVLLVISSQALAFPWHAQGDTVRGAELMTQDERKAYVARLLSMKTPEECKNYMQAHHVEIERRAKERNVALPPVKGDPCAVMSRMGRIR